MKTKLKKLPVWTSFIAVLFLISIMAACSSKQENTASPSTTSETAAAAETNSPETAAPTDEHVTLKFWTWSPSAEIYKPVIEKYESSHPNITIELSVIESLSYQQKMPLALSTGEDIDVIGVQTGGMPRKIQNYLLPLDGVMKTTIGADWQSEFSANSIKQLNSQTDGEIKFLSQGSVGSMLMYYNKDLLDQLGVPAPQTYDDMKNIVKAIKDKKLNVIPVALNGKDAWTVDEVVWTIAGQQSDIYNRFIYNEGGRFDSPEYVKALEGFQKMVDDGVISKKDVFDLDYTASKNLFTSGKAALFIQGTWEAPLIIEAFRADNKVAIKEVGILPIPPVEEGGKASIRSFIDQGLAIVKTSRHPEEAAEFISYLTLGEGNDSFNNQFLFVSNKAHASFDSSMLTSQTAKESYQTLVDLIANPTADRNNNSNFSTAAGTEIIKMILRGVAPSETGKAIQKEFDTGKYPN